MILVWYYSGLYHSNFIYNLTFLIDMEFIAETYTPKTPWWDVPILRIQKQIQNVTCIFERHKYPSWGFMWYLVAMRRRKQVVGNKIQMVTLQIHWNSLHWESERYKKLKSWELPEYKWFEYVFNDFWCWDEKKLRTFL